MLFIHAIVLSAKLLSIAGEFCTVTRVEKLTPEGGRGDKGGL